MSTSQEIFLDCTADRKKFLKNATAYLFFLEFTTQDFQTAKRLIYGYNSVHEETKAMLAKQDDTLYIVIHKYSTLEKMLQTGQATFALR